MAEILPQALGWLDAQKRAALNSLAQALADPLGAAKAFLNPAPEAFAETPQEKIQRLVGGAQSVMPEVARPAAQELAETAGKGMEVYANPFGPAAAQYKMLVSAGVSKEIAAKEATSIAKNAGLIHPDEELYPGQWEKFGSTPSSVPSYNEALAHYNSLVDSGTPEIDAMDLTHAWMKGTGGFKDSDLSAFSTAGTQGLPAAQYKAQLGAPPSPTADLFSSQTFDALAQHGLDPSNVSRIQRYTGETPEDILTRLDAARQNFAQLYGQEGTTAADRAAQLGFGDISNPDQYLWRGSGTPRAELQPPIVTGAKATGTPEAVFGSFPGPTIPAKQWGPIKTPLVARFKQEDLFDATNPYHVAMMPEGIPLPAHGRDWQVLEEPKTIEALKTYNWPGFLTDEGGGVNFGTFKPEMLRHPLAAFDPTQLTSRNIFANLAPITALASALAAQYPGSDLQ